MIIFFLDEKSYENILIYDISYKTLTGAKPLLVRFNKIERFIRVYDGTRYLVLFGGEKYDFIYNRIRYLLGVVWRMFFSHNHAKIKVDSYNSLSLEKKWLFIMLEYILSQYKSLLL